MKKWSLLSVLFLMCGAAIGCADDNGSKGEVLDPVCGHGKQINGICVCTSPYAESADGSCHGCISGYDYNEDTGTCVSNGAPNQEEESHSCVTTFEYRHVHTCAKTGGSQDYDVYLIGDMNNWKVVPEYKMVPRGDGSHLLRLALPKGQSYRYKFYVEGWDEPYRSDASVSVDSTQNNQANINSCGLTFSYNEFGSATHVRHEGINLLKTNVDGLHVSVDVELDKGFEVASVEGAQNQTIADLPGDADSKSSTDDLVAYLAEHGIENASELSEKALYARAEDLVWKDGPFMVGDVEFSLTSIELMRESIGAADAVRKRISIDVPARNDKYVFNVKAHNAETNKDAELYVPVWVEDGDFDWHDAILYFAFTDRFMDGDSSNNGSKIDADEGAEWKGGDFKGLQAKVEEGYFDELGVKALWISSVSMNSQRTSKGENEDPPHNYSAYHSYWPVSTFMTADNRDEFTSETSGGVSITDIEPHFGTLEDLKSLVDACHRRGIRVVVDFAANHVHVDSPIYKNHSDWFFGNSGSYVCDWYAENSDQKNWDVIPESCWFSQDLPDIDYSKPEPRALMVEHARWLVRETNIDGFRVDAVKHMNIQFVRDLRAGLDDLFYNTGITFYTVGETFTGDVGLLNKYIGGDLLHAQFDFPYYYAIQKMLYGNGLDSMSSPRNTYNSDLMGTFMGNHDVGRVITIASGGGEGKWGKAEEVTEDYPYDRVKLAWTVLLTTPGVPLIYYGDEFGMPGTGDPDNRRMMKFGDDLSEKQVSMLSYVRLLGVLRGEHSAMRRGHIETLGTKDHDGRMDAWCYKVSDGTESVIVGVATDACPYYEDCGCGLGTEYQLKDLLNPGSADVRKDGLDLHGAKFQVYQVL